MDTLGRSRNSTTVKHLGRRPSGLHIFPRFAQNLATSQGYICSQRGQHGLDRTEISSFFASGAGGLRGPLASRVLFAQLFFQGMIVGPQRINMVERAHEFAIFFITIGLDDGQIGT